MILLKRIRVAALATLIPSEVIPMLFHKSTLRTVVVAGRRRFGASTRLLQEIATPFGFRRYESAMICPRPGMIQVMNAPTKPAAGGDGPSKHVFLKHTHDPMHPVDESTVRPGRPPLRVLQDVTGSVAVVAAVSYGLAYYWQNSFYQEFRLTPDQAGVDRIGALLRLSPTLFVVGVALVVGGAVAFLVGNVLWWVLVPTRWKTKINKWWLVAAVMIAMAGTLAWSLAVDTSRYDPSGNAARTGALRQLAIGLAFTGFVFILMRRQAPRATLAALAVTVLVLFASTVGTWVGADARYLADTGTASDRLTALGIPVDYAVVRWNDPQRTPESIRTRKPATSEMGTQVPVVLVVHNQSPTGYVFLTATRTGCTSSTPRK